MIPTFQTTFAVPLTCEDCVKDISQSLYKLDGIQKVEADLQSQLVSIEGTAAPSSIVAAIQSTGRDAILRGSGRPNSAAVCILETHSSKVRPDERVKGLVRMVQVASNTTVIDLSIRGLSSGKYYATVREAGDISLGPESTGSVWESAQAKREGSASMARGIWGTLDIGKGGMGSVFLDKPIQIWELIGRGIVVSRRDDQPLDREDVDTLVGVVARSAGIWENDKMVCSCSGKTVWEERKDVVKQGML